MMDIATKPKLPMVPVNPYVAALPPYNSGMPLAEAQAISGRMDIARLASNENPYGCSPAVLSVLGNALEPWRYADPSCTALRAALADFLAVDAGNVVIGNGSEEMIAAISRAVLVPGVDVVTVVPSFGLHEIEPLAAGARVIKIAMTADADFDISALEAAIGAGPRLVFISSPWNPVGPALDCTALARLIASVGAGTVFVLDEAYFEFADAHGPNALAMLKESGVAFVVLRTFSKAYGLAGLRVGYAICSDSELARVVSAAKTPFNVNGAAQLAALVALADQDWMQAAVTAIRAERERVSRVLHSLGFSVAPSQTNFLFVDCDRDSAEVARDLLAQGIVIKPWREAGYTRFLRVTIGLAAENDRFIAAMAQVFGR